MDMTILQVPISKELKKKATKMAKDMGFSSLQELIRLFLIKLMKNELSIQIIDKSTSNYNQMMKRIVRL